MLIRWHRSIVVFFAVSALLASANTAQAGMPQLQFTDIGKMRLETLSFFLGAFLLSAWAVKLIWNSLRKDFPKLPRISYPRALMVSSLWAMLFILILVMISGARELLTPGAWEKNGLTYRVKPTGSAESASISANNLAKASETRLAELKAALWTYANAHGGMLPPNDTTDNIPTQLWETPDPSRARYGYVGGRRIDSGKQVIAYEPGVISLSPLVLFSNGEIKRLGLKELNAALQSTIKP